MGAPFIRPCATSKQKLSKLKARVAATNISLSLTGLSHQALTVSEEARFIAWRLLPKAPHFKGMPKGTGAFLEPLDASGLRPCVVPTIKMPRAALTYVPSVSVEILTKKKKTPKKTRGTQKGLLEKTYIFN